MIRKITFAAALLVATAMNAAGQETPTDVPPLLGEAADNPDMDVLTRGPVHEAFAEQVSPNPVEGITAPEAPPEPVNEVPPELRPEGDDVVWIPGYWFWDDERSDYIWVSGVWRRVPPGRRWVPGYWLPTESGYQWISGFWSPDTVGDVDYVETPPESLETGPSSPAPSSDYFWMPGTWSWQQGAYSWRPGSWRLYREGWIWVAPRYIWTPCGCVYVSGYWDHPLTLRGHLFAPVYYRAPIYRRAGYRYRPVCWIGYEPLLLHLFVRPHCCHLYFGDYYAPTYQQRYVSCYAYHNRYYGYSSLYMYYQQHYRRHGIDYCGRVRDWHHYYAAHAGVRPAHTLGLQRNRHHGLGDALNRHDLLAQPYARNVNDRIAGHRLVPVTNSFQTANRRISSELHDLQRQRERFEVSHRGLKRHTGSAAPSGEKAIARFKLPSADLSQTLASRGAKSVREIPKSIVDTNRVSGTRSATLRGQGPESRGRRRQESGSALDPLTSLRQQYERHSRVTQHGASGSSIDSSTLRRRDPSTSTSDNGSTGRLRNTPARSDTIRLPLASDRLKSSLTGGQTSAPQNPPPTAADRRGATRAAQELRNRLTPDLRRRLGLPAGTSTGSTTNRSTTPSLSLPTARQRADLMNSNRMERSRSRSVNVPDGSQSKADSRIPKSSSTTNPRTRSADLLRGQMRNLGQRFTPPTVRNNPPATSSSSGASRASRMRRAVSSAAGSSGAPTIRAPRSSSSLRSWLGSGSSSGAAKSVGQQSARRGSPPPTSGGSGRRLGASKGR